MDDLMKKHHEDLVKYEKMVESDEEQLTKRKPR